MTWLILAAVRDEFGRTQWKAPVGRFLPQTALSLLRVGFASSLNTIGRRDMADQLQQIETPAWMLELFESIDDLDLSEDGGFRIFADDITLQFGPKTAHGIEAVKQFFTELDAPLITQHFVDVVYRYGNAYFMQGSASLCKKGDPPEKSFQAAPLFNLLWFNDEGKVIRYVVDFPPEAAKSAGF
ncbi:hypothetical protein [Thiocapsa bogorovii]|uniref:hypothetical protein n=1 Tax=Thiocapsa bogorovii TaxID=521689 RepID=UPI001E44F047|nr:hypothetical protein [Thiocapsa bogorovii]UHD15692.1 hypothetical protein LT988_20920 [Thiocapsa bogorovii]